MGARVRSFEEWRAECALKLAQLPSRGRVGTYDFDRQRDYLLSRLKTLTLGDLASFLVDLYSFCAFWKVDYAYLAPTPEEVERWFRGEG